MPFHLSSVRFKKTFYKGKRSAFPNLFFFFLNILFDPFPRLLHHLSDTAEAEVCSAHKAAAGLPWEAPSRSPQAAQPEPGAERTPRGRRPRGRSRSSLAPAPPRRLLPRRCRLRAPLALEAAPSHAPLHSPLLSSCLLLASLRAPARGWRRSDRWVPNAGRICAHPAPVTLAEQRGARSWPSSAAFFSPQTRTGSQTWPGWPCCASPGSSAKAAGRRPPAPAAPCHLQHRRGGRTLKRVGSSPLRFVRT